MACPSTPAGSQCPSTPATTQCPSTPAGSQCPSTPAPCTHTHNYNSLIGTVAPTCTKNGYHTLKCSCGATTTQTICATGMHVYGTSWTNYNDTSHYRVCLTCGGAPKYEAHATSGTCKCGKVITIPVQSVTISNKTLALSIGEEYTISASVIPCNATAQIQWSSNNNNTATVTSNGRVKAVNAGITTIIAYAGGCRAECTVNVNNLIELGSSDYIQDLYKRSESSNYNPSIHKTTFIYDTLISLMITDLKNYKNYYSISNHLWNNFCDYINFFVPQSSGVSQEIHYFRNMLNRTPNSLVEMIKSLNSWKLCSIDDSRYHMYGDKGGFNLKFVSTCGKYEAVYNIYGTLLTEDNDPYNMGTYNYAPVGYSPSGHLLYDVAPYELYGNAPSVGIEIWNRFPSSERYDNDPLAKEYRIAMVELLNSNKDYTTKINEYNIIQKKYVK